MTELLRLIETIEKFYSGRLVNLDVEEWTGILFLVSKLNLSQLLKTYSRESEKVSA